MSLTLLILLFGILNRCSYGDSNPSKSSLNKVPSADEEGSSEDAYHHSNDRMSQPSKDTCDTDDPTCSSNPTIIVENEVFIEEESLDIVHSSEQTGDEISLPPIPACTSLCCPPGVRSEEDQTTSNENEASDQAYKKTHPRILPGCICCNSSQICCPNGICCLPNKCLPRGTVCLS